MDLLPYLSLFYEEVRLPSEVEREFIELAGPEEEKSARFDFITQFYQDHDSWFVACSEYGEDLVQLYLTESKMDRGEAEALAQNQFYDNNYEVIVDERIARSLAKAENMNVKGTLALIAHMEHGFGLCDYYLSVEKLKVEINTYFGKKIVKQVYEEVKLIYFPSE